MAFIVIAALRRTQIRLIDAFFDFEGALLRRLSLVMFADGGRHEEVRGVRLFRVVLFVRCGVRKRTE